MPAVARTFPSAQSTRSKPMGVKRNATPISPKIAADIVKVDCDFKRGQFTTWRYTKSEHASIINQSKPVTPRRLWGLGYPTDASAVSAAKCN